MSNVNSGLISIAERLGVKDVAFKKAEEFLRVFHSKGAVKRVNDTTKTVVCLDLATTYMGLDFDKQTAIKLFGLQKSAYQNTLNTVEKLLELDKPLSISELCVQLSCTVIKDVAEDIYSAYRNNNINIEDLDHPQYVAAAVYTACKIKSIKIEKPKFILISRLKPARWNELITEFEKFASSLGFVSSKSKKKCTVNSETDKKTVPENNAVLEIQIPKRKDCDDEEIEEYEAWKARILTEAYNALGIH